jgi:GNAT superfamily N-acetyltransferase
MTTVPLQLPLFQSLPTMLKPSALLLGRNSSLPLSVRPLSKQSEIDDLIPLARAFAQEVPLAGEEFDELMLRTSLGVILNNQSRRYQELLIAYEGDTAVGFLLASISHSMYADRKIASKELWYVTPSHRGTKTAIRLLSEYEIWAQMNGATISLTGSNVERSAEKMTGLLEKLGYHKIGVTFVKEF